MNGVKRTVKIGDTLVHGVEIDWEKKDWKRIYTPEEEKERKENLMRLVGGPDSSSKLLAASSKKPTFRIKRLKGASSVLNRERAEKALRLNGG